MKYERNEYPRPQFGRDEWKSLNGEWEFEFDDERTGEARRLFGGKTKLSGRINVPFSYQCEASGIADKTTHDIMWYRRSFTVHKDRRALLFFNGVDYKTDVWINGVHVITHVGGFTPFKADITDFLDIKDNVIVVRCEDTLDSTQPRGKQSWTGEPFSCFYTPNSGIWQSVWIEYFDVDCIDEYLLDSDADDRSIFGYIQTLYGSADELKITLKFKDNIIKKQLISLDGRRTKYEISLSDNAFDFGAMLWNVDMPNLLYVDYELYKDGKICDRTHTRIGIRKISIENGKICINDRPLFQRLVLDQGYWNESGLTPPSAEALKKDIELAKAMGFNGARKHQKFEDPYYYYYADEMGFLVWAEMPSAYTFCEKEVKAITSEWQEIVNSAKNFTSVIVYVPLNESWGVREIKTNKRQQDFAKSLYYLTKSLDDTRIISTNDGFETIENSDILGIHDYDIKSKDEFSEKYGGDYDGMYPQGWALFADGHKYMGQPMLLTEFGGIAFADEQSDRAWGYGNGAKNDEELCEMMKQLVDGISRTEFQGYCYTQLTDVQQEVNGLLYIDRTPKIGLAKLKKIFQ